MVLEYCSCALVPNVFSFNFCGVMWLAYVVRRFQGFLFPMVDEPLTPSSSLRAWFSIFHLLLHGNRSVSLMYTDGFRTSQLLLTLSALFPSAWSGAVSEMGAGDLTEGLAD